ncbi:MAG: hypothetical protein GX465_17505, partial [Acidobacteria bacterium]|nr:hypothetical protein [Acidobacteriota bacterium]
MHFLTALFLPIFAHFSIFLLQCGLKTAHKCSHNTTTKYLKNFKKITRLAISNG